MPFLKKYWKFIFPAIVFLVILILVLVFLALNSQSTNHKNQTKNTTPSSVSTATTSGNSSSSKKSEPNTGPIKTIGINLDYYNSTTGRAGDFLFTKKKLQFGRVFMPYGFVIPGNNTSSGNDKANPQPTFVVPTGTKVLSLVDGTVFNVGTVWSGDYSIQVTADGQTNNLIYETEHVINPLVKKGDSVKAGQVIAEVSDFDSNTPSGYGTVEIGVLDGSGGTPKHLCPFLYLDPSVKQQILTKLQDLMKNWETYIGNATLYDESLAVPGCQTLDPIPG